jgi:hypothetical protein
VAVGGGGFVEAAETAEEVGAGGGKQVVVTQRRGFDRVERGEAGGGPVRQSDGAPLG